MSGNSHALGGKARASDFARDKFSLEKSANVIAGLV